jgi:hypothetical protein
MYSIWNCHNVEKYECTVFSLGHVQINVTPTCNAGCLKKIFTIVFQMLTVWRVLGRFQLKAYKLSTFQHLER